ncbi:MAG: GtrA family protein [Oscillospiraceae bacterium]|nr:GtrA family protein [Oscillospiraceae bacterium]
MKELLQLIFRFDLKSLFLTPTDNGMIKFFRYCFVGGIAFVADFLSFGLTCKLLGEGKAVIVTATTAGFIVGLTVNFLLSKKFVFTEDANNTSRKGEFIWYTVIGLIGWGLNVILMLVCTEWIFAMNKYIAKIIVALIVLVYNYLARKIILYSK